MRKRGKGEGEESEEGDREVIYHSNKVNMSKHSTHNIKYFHSLHKYTNIIEAYLGFFFCAGLEGAATGVYAEEGALVATVGDT